jgi:hypothetical protein
MWIFFFCSVFLIHRSLVQIRLEGPMFDSVGSLVGSTECLLIWIVLDLNTQVRAAVYSLRVYKLLVWSRTTRQSSLVGVGGYLARPVKYSWRL